jgi:hypothetical protein
MELIRVETTPVGFHIRRGDYYQVSGLHVNVYLSPCPKHNDMNLIQMGDLSNAYDL